LGLKLLVICYIFRTCTRWRSFMHNYFRYDFDLVFIVYIFTMHWKKLMHQTCVTLAGKEYINYIRPKQNIIKHSCWIEIVDKVLGWWTFIHQGYKKTHFLVQICKKKKLIFSNLLQGLSDKVIQHPLRTVCHFI
jgi:hypothetical protein